MNHVLPNTTAEAVGFTIPGRSSSLREHSQRSSKASKKPSLDNSRDEVAKRMRSLSLERPDPHLRSWISFDSSPPIKRQTLQRATSSSTSTSSSNAPLSLYRNHKQPKNKHNGDLLRQTSLKIKTFRATGIPDPRNSPSISAHPANSCPESPIIPLSGSSTILSADDDPFNRLSAPQNNYTSAPRADLTPQLILPRASPAKRTEDTPVNTDQAPAVTPETIHRHTEDIILERIISDIHYHDPYTYLQPSRETVHVPAQHYATGIEGKVIKIPVALGETLELVKEKEPKKDIANMGWE